MRAIRYTSLTLLLIILIQSLGAQTNEDVKKKLSIIQHYRSTQLDNGLTVICLTTHNTDKFFLRSYSDIPGYVDKEYQTLSLVDSELRKSTDFNLPKGWSNSQIQSLNIELGRDEKGFYASCSADNLTKTLELISDVFQNPVFDASEINEAKKNVISDSDSLTMMPNNKIDKITKSIIYGKEHPILKQLDLADLNKINVAEYQNFYQRFYTPHNSYLLVIGNISLDSIKTMTENILGSWKSKKPPKAEYKLLPIEEPKIVFFDSIPNGKTNIKILFPFALSPFTFNSEKAELLSVLFQDLLTDKLINKEKLANKIEAKFESDKITGNYQLNVQLNKDSLNSVIESIISTISLLNKAEYSNEKLELAKRKIISDFTNKNVDDNFISKLIITSEINSLPKEYYANFVDDINNVDKTSMRIFAAKYLNYNTSLFQIPGHWYQSLNDFIQICKKFRIELYKLDGSLHKVIPKGFNGFSVINNYVDAIGGKDNISKIKNLRINYGMTYKFPDETEMIIKGEILRKSENRFFELKKIIRPEQGDSVFLQLQIYDGTVGIDSTSSGTKLLAGEKLKRLQYKAPIVPEVYYKEWSYNASLTSADTLNNAYVWVVEIDRPTGQKITDYYDVDKGLRYKRIIYDDSYFKKQTITYNNYIEDRKKHILHPYLKQVESDGTVVKMKITEIDFKSRIDKEHFEISKHK